MFSSRHISLVIFLWCRLTLATSDEQGNFHLLDNYTPASYKLLLTVDPDRTEFSGEVQISFSVTNKTNSIFLHASPTRITSLSKVFNIEQNSTCDYSYLNETTDVLNITCERPLKLKPGLNKILISYTGLYDTVDDTGLYKASYDTDNGKEHYLITQFKPTYARTMFPCFDEPHFKARFQLDVSYPEHYTALFSAQFQWNDRSNGRPFVQFLGTQHIPTYLVAFVLSKFEHTSNQSSVPWINIYSRKNQRNRTGTALYYAKHLMDTLQDWTNINYHKLYINKVDLVAVPELAVGVGQNWDLLTFREANLLDEGDNTTARDKQNIISTIANKLSYHWFGGVVTHDLWSNAWLSNGFARYLQYHITDKVCDMELERQFVPLVFQKALEFDGADVSPMSSSEEEIYTVSDSRNKRDVINSDKGASIIRMIRNLLGEDNFHERIKNYLKTHSFKTVSPNDLVDALSKFTTNKNIDFKDVTQSWIYKSGYPVVIATFNATNNTVIISQKEFQPREHDPEDKVWKIPVTWITSSTYNNRDVSNVDMVWLRDQTPFEMQMNNDSWIILNYNQIGYYRVNYDNELWNRIIFALKSDDMNKIPVSSRAQLIDDAFALAKAGQLEYGMVFYLAKYMVAETEFEPWYAAAKSLKYLLRVLEVNNEKNALANLKGLVLNWINRAHLKLKAEPETHLKQLTNEILFDLRCHMGDKDCLRESEKIFDTYKKTNFIEDYSTRQTAFCFALKQSQSPEDDYDILMDIYANSSSAIEKEAILFSLGCINDKMILEKYLSEMLSTDTKIPKTDLPDVYKTIISNSQQGIDLALDFLEDHLHGIVTKYGSLIDLSELILEPARWIVTNEQTKLLNKVLQKYKKLKGMHEVSENAKTEIFLNKRWFQKYSSDIEAAVQSLLSSTSITIPCITTMILSLLIILKL